MDRSKEYIICAACWYRDFEVKKAVPAYSYLPTNLTQGMVFCGHRHAQCIYSLVAITGEPQYKAGHEVQGFLTSKNRFVDREEGRLIALECGQIEKSNYHSNRIFSEDLY